MLCRNLKTWSISASDNLDLSATTPNLSAAMGALCIGGDGGEDALRFRHSSIDVTDGNRDMLLGHFSQEI
jgi:hypothetical protein